MGNSQHLPAGHLVGLQTVHLREDSPLRATSLRLYEDIVLHFSEEAPEMEEPGWVEQVPGYSLQDIQPRLAAFLEQQQDRQVHLWGYNVISK